ncbi:MAG: hypothetical protein ACRDL6_02560 [Solirubrobacterales bacterium]
MAQHGALELVKRNHTVLAGRKPRDRRVRAVAGAFPTHVGG